MPDEVDNDVEGRVQESVRWGGSVAVATEVRGDGPLAHGRKGQKLVAPHVPNLREAVEEQYH